MFKLTLDEKHPDAAETHPRIPNTVLSKQAQLTYAPGGFKGTEAEYFDLGITHVCA